MKKSFTVFAILLVLGLMLVACSGDAIGNKNSIASISFGEKGLSKSLSTTIEGPSVSSLYWRYTAVKTGGGSSSGATDSGVSNSVIIAGTDASPSAGLGGEISGFSVGTWTFEVFGYVSASDCTAKNTNYAYYQQVTNQTLEAGIKKTISITVSPDNSTSGAKGKLVFQNIEVLSGSSYTWSYSLDGTNFTNFTTGSSGELNNNIVNKTFTNEAVGTKTVIIKGTSTSDSTEIKATIKVNVYRGLTSTVEGSVTGLTTSIQFEDTSSTDVYYTVTYKANTGSENDDSAVTLPEVKLYKSGTNVTLGTAARTGYALEGWYTEEACTNKVTSITGISENKTLYAKWTEVKYLTFTANTAGSTVKPCFASGDWAYSTNGTDWTEIKSSDSTKYNKTTITLTNAGDSVYLKGTDCKTGWGYWFTMTGSISASGDVTALTNDGLGGDVALTEDCYSYMFHQCGAVLTTAPALPSKTLAKNCYGSMFYGCSSLTTAPALPATTLAESCYINMFSGCTSLTTVPALPATTLVKNCYSGMFSNCTSLYVSTSIVSGSAVVEWRIPSTGNFENAESQGQFCDGCLSAPDNPTLNPVVGGSITFYTQNTPVPAN